MTPSNPSWFSNRPISTRPSPLRYIPTERSRALTGRAIRSWVGMTRKWASGLTSKCAAGGVVVQCGTALPARPHHCKVGPLGIQKDGSLCSRGSELLTSFPRSNLASIFLTAFLTSTRIKNGPVITAKTKKARIGKTNAPQILHASSFVSTAPASFMMGTVTWYPQTPASGSVNHSAISSNHTYNATISLVSIFPHGVEINRMIQEPQRLIVDLDAEYHSGSCLALCQRLFGSWR